jgi:hypothetical protein
LECDGCKDGYFAQHLVRNLGWSYSRLPLDGLRSVVFDGPSPTHCIAAGNVWYDHPCPGKAKCLTHETVMRLYTADKLAGSGGGDLLGASFFGAAGAAAGDAASLSSLQGGAAGMKMFDWQRFHFKDRTCLRHSSAMFDRQKCD